MVKYSLIIFLVGPCLLAAQTPLYNELIKVDLEKVKNSKEVSQSILKMEKELLAMVDSRKDTIAADVYSYLGSAYWNAGDFEKAISFYEKEEVILNDLLPIREEWYSNTLYNLAEVYLASDKLELARVTGQKLIKNDQKLYGIASEQYVTSLFKFIEILVATGEIELAEQMLDQLMKQLPDLSSENGMVLSKLAELCSFSGKYTKSERLFFDALELLRISDGEDSEIYNTTLSNYAFLLLKQGKYDKAEELLDQVLTKSVDEDWFTGSNYYATLNNFAIVQNRLGQYSKSEDAYKKLVAFDSATIGLNHPDFSITLSNLGLLYIDQGKLELAEKTLLQALEILKQNKDTKSRAYAIRLNNLAKVYQRSGKFNESINLLGESQKVIAKASGKESVPYALATFNLGVGYLYLKSPKALSYLKEARDIRARVLGKSHPLYAECEERIAQYYWMKKNKAETGQLYKNVFDNYYGQIDNFFPVLTEEEKANFFFQKIKPSVETYASFAVSQANDPKLLGQLFDYHVNTKGLILQATEKVRKSIAASGDSSLISLYQKWEDAKDVLTYSYSVHQSQSVIDSLVRASNDLEKELTRKSASFAKNLDRSRIDWRSIQSKLKPGEAALECLRYRIFNADSLQFSNRVGYAFLLLTSETKEGPLLIHLSNGNQLEDRLLKYYRNGIRLKVDDLYTFKNFWEPIHDQLLKLKIKKVFFSPDGVYNTINISSLRNPFSNQYLIDELDLRRVTSTRTLLEEASNRKNRGVGYLLGFPDYKVEGQSTQVASVKSTSSGTRSFRGGMLRLLRNGEGIPPLPGTKLEVEQISASLKNQFQSVEVKLQTNAVESELKSLANPSLIHIATHGYFLDEDEDAAVLKMPNPLMMSGLILAGAENFIQTGHNPLQEKDDGILTAYEAMNLNLDGTSLVVLSACETGLGKVQAGEGVYGLQRAFQVAGAESIIMSLWSVDDAATQLLMTLFYTQYLQTNDLYESFRMAQQKLKEKYPEPFYWGAFILVGRGQ